MSQKQRQFQNQKTKKPEVEKPSTSVPSSQQTKAEKKDGSNNNGWILKLLPCILFVLFAVFAYWILAVKNTDYLYAVQDRSLWLNDTSFFNNKMKYAGGLMQWLGCYCTQYFYHPWMGALMLIGLWALTYFATIKAFRVKNIWSVWALIPVSALLASIICIGYWMYYAKYPGYWFSQTWSVLVMMLGIWGIRNIKNSIVKAVAVAIWVIAFYPLLGAWALIGALWMIVLHWVDESEESVGRKGVWSVILLVLIGIVPRIYYNFLYVRMRIDDVYDVNFPIFQNDQITSPIYSIPFIIIALCPIIFIFFNYVWKNQAEKQNYTKGQNFTWMACTVVVLAMLGYFVHKVNYDDYNFNAEHRMYRALDNADYDKILEEAAHHQGPMTRQMVISKNIALMNKGTIGSQMFHYDNSGKPPVVYDSLMVHLVQTCGPMVYYQYGKANFASRWSIENSVEFGWTVDALKTLTRCAMISNENKVALKYINMLKNTTFHREWAEQWEKYLRDKKLYHQTLEYQNIQPLRGYDNTLDGDEGLVEMYIINYFSHVHKRNPKFQEQTLAFSLIQKDIDLFWPRFFNYATLHEKEEMPIHYQEAAFLYGNLERGKVDITHMPFDKEKVMDRYGSFQQTTQKMLNSGMSVEQVGNATRATFGDTFWWFYFFCRNIHSY